MPGGVDDKTFGPIPFEDAAHVADIVREARDDEIGVVVWGRVRQERPPLEDVVAREGDEHGVLDIVVEGVAVADAFQREFRSERNDLGKARVRTIVTATHTRDELQFALDAFGRVGRALGIVQ